MAITFIKNIIHSGYNLSKINNNFEKIEAAFEDALSRSGTSPNHMNTDLDMNGHNLINVGSLDASSFSFDGSEDFQTLITSAEAAAVTATSAKDAAVAAKNSAEAAASSVNPSNYYMKTQIDGFRTTDQNAAKDAGNLTTGTLPDARLPDRLSYAPAWDGITLTDCNAAIHCGWYFAPITVTNGPPSGYWIVHVSAAANDALRQDAYSWDYGTHYRRTLVGTTWSNWERVYETAAEIQSIVTNPLGSTATVSLTGGLTTEVLSLPANIRVLNIDLILTIPSNQGYGSTIQLGTSASYPSSGYWNNPSGANSITNGIYLGTGAELVDWPINVRLTRLNNHFWSFVVDQAYFGIITGTINLGAELTKLKFVKSTGTAPINNSQMKISWEF